MSILDVHRRSLGTSTALSVYYIPNAMTPLQAISVLNSARIPFVLVGSHGLGGWWADPRATQDVDVLVSARAVKKAVRELLVAYPHLEADICETVTHLRVGKTHSGAIDVIKPHQELMRLALRDTCAVEIEGENYRIPSLEMAMAMKFARMKSMSWAEAKKHLDAHDFISMIKTNPEIDLDKLAKLGDLVYSGGGAELVQKVGQVRRREQLTL
jgi:hypothetical protein